MDANTLALLGQSSEVPEDTPSSDVPQPPDQGEQKPETPEAMIARGEIPEGYTRDSQTGEIRPKKTRGRPRKGTAAPAPTSPIQRGTDEAPDSGRKGKVPPATPKYQKGVIAAGMTKLYKRTGRIIKAMDRDIGIAVIESAEDCGEAWDELARTNPRVRAFLMKLISGGAMGAVLMAHLPIFMAIVLKTGIAERIPLIRLLVSDDDDYEEDEDEDEDENPLAGLLGGMSQEDMGQMMSLAQGLMGGMARRVPGAVVRGEGE